MVRFFAIVCMLFVLASCTEVNYKVPQPRGERSLKEVPGNLHGRYLGIDQQTGKTEDTLIVNSRGFQLASSLKSEQPSKEDRLLLCDTVMLKKYKGYYFVNVKNNIAWRSYALKQESNGDLTHSVLQQKENATFNDFLYSLSNQITIDSVQERDQTYYVIDPSPKQLIELIDKNYFVKFTWKKIK